MLEDEHFNFTVEEATSLASWETTPKLLVEYHGILTKSSQDLQALVFELSQVSGNWDRKDRVIPGLAHEIVQRWEDARKKLESKMDNYISKEFDDFFEEKPLARFKGEFGERYHLVTYLLDQFKKEFGVTGGYFNGDEATKPSSVFSHLLMTKFMKRFKIRLSNAFKFLSTFISDRIHYHATRIFREFANDHITKNSPAMVDNAEKYFWDARNYKNVKAHYDELLFPMWDNSEYKLGLKPVLGGYFGQVFFFGNPEIGAHEIQGSAFKVVILNGVRESFEFKGDFMRDYTREKSFTKWFGEMDGLVWFKNWLRSKEVIDTLADKLCPCLRDKVDAIVADPSKLSVARNEVIKEIERRYILLKQWYGNALPSAMFFLEKMKQQVLENTWWKDEQKSIRVNLVTPIKEGEQVAG